MNIKKTFTTIVSLVIAFSSFAASAAVNVPQPKNNDEAYAYALSFYKDGYYYEAKQELEMVNTAGPGYDAAKSAAWMESVDAKIAKLQADAAKKAEKEAYNAARAQVKQIIANAKKLNSELKFQDALNEIYKANNIAITVSEYELLTWWEDALLKNLSSAKYAPVSSNIKAINVVKNVMPLESSYETYYAVKVASGEWHVYITTRTPAGVREDVAAFRVYSDGSYWRAF